MGDLPGGWDEIIERIFSIHAALHGMPVELDLLLRVAQLASAGDADLFGNDVDAGHHFCDGVLHLQTCVHFEKIEIAVFVHQEFDGACVDVIHCLRGFDRDIAHLFAQFIVEKRRRRLFHKFLMAALDGTFTLA